MDSAENRSRDQSASVDFSGATGPLIRVASESGTFAQGIVVTTVGWDGADANLILWGHSRWLLREALADYGMRESSVTL